MKLPIQLSKDSREPIYHQLEKQLKALIAGGHLSAGTALPSIRVLAKDLEISVITTRRAYQNLESGGFIRTVQGKGTFVAEVEDDLMLEVKVATVHQAFEKAVDTAFKYDYTFKQIEGIFQDVLTSYKNNGGGSKS